MTKNEHKEMLTIIETLDKKSTRTDTRCELLTHEIEQLELLKDEQIKYDQMIKNQKMVQKIAIVMIAFALLSSISMLLESQPAVTLAILCGLGGGYLINIKKQATGA